MSADIKTHLANDLEQSAAMLDSREFDAVQLDNCASMMRYAATVIRQALEQPAPAQESDPDELTIAYLNGIDTGKKRKPWVGLTKQEENELCDKYWRAPIRVAILAVEEKLMEKNQ